MQARDMFCSPLSDAFGPSKLLQLDFARDCTANLATRIYGKYNSHHP